jgi:lipid II:glycine glycyltransferase (peptidoglycan interpeptide bridge formation enzyme)
MYCGDTATYLHGASSNDARNLMAPYALHWAIIRHAKDKGCSRYDLWGISDDPKSGWAGITRFKRGWGGKEVCAPGTFDLPISNFWYNVYRLARRMKG